MSNIDEMQSELEMFEMMVVGFTGSLIRSATKIPHDKWNWSFSERTPTAREICEHAYVWLWCDRMQITRFGGNEPFPTPELPSDQDSMLAILKGEADAWRTLIRSFESRYLADQYQVFGEGDNRNLRGFLFHMGQHLIYKVGQLSVLFYDLGLDGPEPYAAICPNELYGFRDQKSWPEVRS